MEKEVIEMFHAIGKKYVPESEPDIFLSHTQAIEEIIQILEKNKLTYAEAYATLDAVYGTLKYKSTKVNL